jgi:hypothetical protein
VAWCGGTGFISAGSASERSRVRWGSGSIIEIESGKIHVHRFLYPEEEVSREKEE